MGGFISLSVSIVLSAVIIFYFVLLIPYFCRFTCPLSVGGNDSGRYFWTALTVRPGHVTNWLLCSALRRVALGGLNAAWCRYWMRLALDVMAYALCAYYLCVSEIIL